MTRGAFRTGAAAGALALLGLLGWLLLSGRGGVSTGEEGGGARGSNVSPTDTLDPGPSPAPGPPGAGPRAAPAGGPGPAGAPGGEAPAAAEERTIPGVCVLEDGRPLAGVGILYARGPGGGKSPVSDESAADGTVRVPADLPFAVRHATVVLAAVEGGAVSGDGRSVTPDPGASLLRLVFRDAPGWAHVRLVDAGANLPVESLGGLQVRWHIPGGWLSAGYDDETAPGGWIPIPEDRLPETGPGSGDRADLVVDPSKVAVEFAMPGYEAARRPLQEIRGRVEIRVQPVPPDASGKVEVDVKTLRLVMDAASKPAAVPAEAGSSPVSSRLRWTGPDPAPSTDGVLGLPRRLGEFRLYGLPDGPWELEVAATLPDNVVVRGRRAFERRGDTVDLGTIELRPSGKVVLRVVDSAGEPVPQAWAVVVRPDEDPEKGRRLDLDGNGSVAVGDLEPGASHRAVVKGLPRDLEQAVVAAADPKAVVFAWPGKLVPCRLRLLVDGKAVSNPDDRTTIPAVVQESPLPREKGTWRPDGTFEASLVPGTYRFSVLATPKEGGALAPFSAEFTVPAGDLFEARLELQREGR